LTEHTGGILAAIGPRAALFSPAGDQLTEWTDVLPETGAALTVPDGVDEVRYGLAGALHDRPDYLSPVLPTVSAGETVRVRVPEPGRRGA
jgi:hypothetical protein